MKKCHDTAEDYLSAIASRRTPHTYPELKDWWEREGYLFAIPAREKINHLFAEVDRLTAELRAHHDAARAVTSEEYYNGQQAKHTAILRPWVIVGLGVVAGMVLWMVLR